MKNLLLFMVLLCSGVLSLYAQSDKKDVLIDVTSTNVVNLSTSPKLFVLYFGTETIEICSKMTPIIERVAAKYKEEANAGYCDVNKQQNDQLIEKYCVRNLPMILLLKEGLTMFKQVGVCTQITLEQEIEKLLP